MNTHHNDTSQIFFSSLIELAKEANAEPVFIGVVFEHIPKDSQSEVLCGDEFIFKYTGLIAIKG